MRQLKQWAILLFFVAGMGFSPTVWGCEKIEISYQHHYPELTAIKAGHPAIRQVYGEVLRISPAEITLRNRDGIVTAVLNSNTLIYCNGMPSSWQALLPVATEAFFEARVYLKNSQVVAVEGFYYGEEVMITGWEDCGERLKLKLFSLCRQTTEIRLLSESVSCPRNAGWLNLNQKVFVLYGADETVRAVYHH